MVSEAAADTVNVLATIATACIFLSMVPEHVIAIYRSKSTASTNFYPLLAMFAQCIGWVLYGWASDALFPVSAVNGFGAIMAIVFWVVFLKFEKENRKRYIAYIIATVVLMVALTLYAFLSPQSKSDVADVIGYIANAGAIILFASPMFALTRVVREKCSDILSLGMAASGCVNGYLWTAYGVIQSDNYVLVPNCISATLCVIQLIFIVIFPRSKKEAATASTPITEFEKKNSTQASLLEQA
ncbi:hypothetical protein Poli38472_001012 [Pythium oligandrum]|uniref:Sugar transporter SWEET1 n=1 Tax=Pythium oligandrum TaxID=41045 RepID=A0A8K1CS66_PYTOL|nr:hypothetical protein Poli38472_001012 [Pythium oligandrum]|eukprot:TMW68856.1 hypothetical protein Poli38472_001012 [Pythium oligandrum]